MVDAVLLEWEGVLADTSAARRDALLLALREEGVHFDPARFGECCEGRDVTSAARAAIGVAGREDPVLAELVALRARRTFAERLGTGITLNPGAVAFAERICMGTRVAMVTAASRSETELLLRLAGLEAAVSTIITSDDALDGAPSAEAYRKAVDHLSRIRPVRAAHVVALVGSARAIRAASEAGVRTVAAHLPAHVAVEADGAVSSLETLTLDELSRAAGIETAGRR